MRTCLIFILGLFFSNPGQAAPSTESVVLNQNITQEKRQTEIALAEGQWEVGGGGGIGYGTVSGVIYAIQPRAQYFVLDRVSVGGSLNLQGDGEGFTERGLGPAATYYFYTSNQFAAFLRQRFEFTENLRENEDSEFRQTLDGVTSIGGAYFFNDFVALGLSLDILYAVDGRESFDGISNTLAVLGGSLLFYF